MRQVSAHISDESIRLANVVCFATMRNEVLRIESFLNHYRSIGVEYFIIVDNASDDGTIDILKSQVDVAVFYTDDEFGKSSCGINWLHVLLDRYRPNRWALTVDADELFVYPHYENRGMRELCRCLDDQRRAAVIAIMVDMYSERSIRDTLHVPAQPLIESCGYFDGGPYEIMRHRDVFPFVRFRGGARKRFFWENNSSCPPPSITKVPLVKWNGKCRYSGLVHEMNPPPGLLSEVSGALLHFKYMSDFHVKARIEVERGQHFDGAREYVQYAQIMDRDQSASLYYEGSVRYEGSNTLLTLGLIKSDLMWDKVCGETTKFSGVSRNALCPCGSGKRFKHCHGAIF
jgi:glycosyltransferase involved in cell wall biosynthesis